MCMYSDEAAVQTGARLTPSRSRHRVTSVERGEDCSEEAGRRDGRWPVHVRMRNPEVSAGPLTRRSLLIVAFRHAGKCKRSSGRADTSEQLVIQDDESDIARTWLAARAGLVIGPLPEHPWVDPCV